MLIIRKLINVISHAIDKMITYFKGDVRRINHALKVYGFSINISDMDGVSERDRIIISLSAILHDIGIHEAERKHNSTSGKYQELEGPPIAKDILQGIGVPNDIIDRVCFLIGNHHSYQNIDGLDFQILIEADFLVNIFEDNMSRDSVLSIRDKYFKTNNGIKIINSMYL
jgi:HD superfamily phosphodiesterase